MRKYNLKYVILLIILCLLLNINNVSKADTEQVSTDMEYSYEYKRWLALPEEEKENCIMPPMYNTQLNNSDIAAYSVVMNSNEQIPTKYNTADYIDINIRNQKNLHCCWAITTTELFEIAYAKILNNNKIESFSERHMNYSCSRKSFNNGAENEFGYGRDANTGGRFEYSEAYYSSGRGPILQKDMPFIESEEKIDISEIQNKTVQAQLEDYVEFPQIRKIYDENNNPKYFGVGNYNEYSQEEVDEFRKIIKQHIMKYGAVATYTYYNNSYFSKEDGYIFGNSYFCNDSTSAVRNHTVCIVGWDDNYSRENFREECRPANDGAYIALNSWGTEWNSNNGYYYISYDDYFVEYNMAGIQGISNIDYDNIYQYDIFGLSAWIYSNYNATTFYGANVFKREDNTRELLKEIGLYIYNTTDATIYLNQNGNNLNINNLEKIAEANNLTPGYHVIKLDSPRLVGNTFSIVVKYHNDIKACIPLEAKLNNANAKYYAYVSSNEGESFYSTDGKNFMDFYEFEGDEFTNANVCIKAFTVSETEKANSENYILNNNWRVIKNTKENMLLGIEENTTIENILSSNNFSNEYDVKIYKNNNEVTTGNVTTGTVIKIFENSNLIKKYTIVIYGDTNLDGNIASIDALTVVKNKLGTEKFKNKLCEEAGKVTTKTRTLNLTPSAIDALAIVKHKLGIDKITQY